MSWWRRTRAHWWLIRKVGPVNYAQYERVRRVRLRESGEEFDPLKHGERMLRAVGATEEQIMEAKAKGLA
jgi:hypothetical protein